MKSSLQKIFKPFRSIQPVFAALPFILNLSLDLSAIDHFMVVRVTGGDTIKIENKGIGVVGSKYLSQKDGDGRSKIISGFGICVVFQRCGYRGY